MGQDVNAGLEVAAHAVAVAIHDVVLAGDEARAQSLQVLPRELVEWQHLRACGDRRFDTVTC